MNHLNRRQWLKTAGITGAFTFLGIPRSFTETTLSPKIPTDLALNPVTKLNANENPYGPSQKVREALVRGFEKACRYPFTEREELQKLLAEKEGLTPDHIIITVGSTEGLKITGLTYGIGGHEIIAADPVFKALIGYAENFGAFIHRVPLNDKLEHDLEEMERRITGNTSLIFLCNPSNPSGTIIPANKLEPFCDAVSERTLVFSDEAYFDYITEPNYPSMLKFVKKGKNVIVSRTFSKVYGLAGLRIGYLISRPDIIARLRKNQVDRPNMLAIFAAKAALQDPDFYQYSKKMNAEAKQYIYQTLDELKLTYVPSHTNFVFFKTGREVTEVIDAFEAERVQVGRPFPPMRDWCRVSTGTMEDVKALGKGMRKVFA